MQHKWFRVRGYFLCKLCCVNELTLPLLSKSVRGNCGVIREYKLQIHNSIFHFCLLVADRVEMHSLVCSP